MPGVAFLNFALRSFEPKVVFGWHCSIMVECDLLADQGMPTRAEQGVLQGFQDRLAPHIAGANPKKPNALYLGRITWNGTRELLYRVWQPEPVHEFLQGLIETENHPRHFDYRLDPDPEWKLAAWHLNLGK